MTYNMTFEADLQIVSRWSKII